MSGGPYLIRADATPETGSGHVMRCLALAEALMDRGRRCHLATAALPPALDQRLRGARVIIDHLKPAEDAAALVSLATRIDASAIILDGYQFTSDYRRTVRAGGRPVMTFKDLPGETPLHADLVLSTVGTQNRRAAPGARWLGGPAYALLRRELAEAAALLPRPAAERDRILVVFGGTDPAGLTAPVAAALNAALPEVPLDIIIGAGVVEGAAVAEACAGLGHVSRDPPDLAQRMRAAGLAVSAAGTMVVELAALGVPAVFAVVAENQATGITAAVRDGWCRAIDARSGADVPARLAETAAQLWHDHQGRAAMSARARSLVDGQGAGRVAAVLIALAEAA